MVNCSFCGKKLDYLPFECKFCGKYFCTEHRLPENHACVGLEKYKEEVKEGKYLKYEPSKVRKEIKIGEERIATGIKLSKKAKYILIIIIILIIIAILYNLK